MQQQANTLLAFMSASVDVFLCFYNMPRVRDKEIKRDHTRKKRGRNQEKNKEGWNFCTKYENTSMF